MEGKTGIFPIFHKKLPKVNALRPPETFGRMGVNSMH